MPLTIPLFSPFVWTLNSEQLFRKAADRLAEDGYRDVGYEYVIIDDCWMEKERDEAGRLVADRKRFPNGIKALADYVRMKCNRPFNNHSIQK